VTRSGRRFAPGFACAPAVVRRPAPVLSGRSPVLGGGGSVVRGWSAPSAGELGLVRLYRIADRSLDVASPGRPVPGFRSPVSGVSLPIELVEVAWRRGPVRVVARSHRPSVTVREKAAIHHGLRFRRGELLATRPVRRGAHGEHSKRLPSTSWTVPATARNVGELRHLVVEFARANGVPEPRVIDVGLAVSEALTNAVMHAFRGVGDHGTVKVAVAIRRRRWIDVRVADDGSGMSPRDDSPGLGLGLPLIRHLSDQFDHGRPPGGGGTELWMRFRFTETGGSPG
jgi:serine/threonine-protein kinase RsbW